ncbi:MAG: flagellar export chaperone FlgN [Thermodesulfobacteriota bacterium]
MEESTGQFKDLEELMVEEIRQYNLLIEKIKEEGQYLRQNSVELLLKSISQIDKQREILVKINETLRKELKRAANSSELKEEILAHALPLPIYHKWQRHQKEVAHLKERVHKLNLQNKAFIQEILAYWRELMDLIASSGSNLSYHWVKGNNPKTNPFFLNQRV